MRALTLAGADLVLVPQAGAVGEWPEGLYEAEARAGLGTEEILYADVDLASTASSHVRLLFLRHRRPRLYGERLTK
jgi:predicted amidohydrolase